jgi:hypothetical protein
MFKINVSDVLNFVKDKSYSDIVKECEEYGLCVKYSNDDELKNLFLLANKNDSVNDNVNVNVNKNNENDNENDNDNDNNNNGDNDNDNTNTIKKGPINYQANGIIFEKETNKVVAMCQNKLITCNNINEISDINELKRIEYCEDGTMIRLYNYNDTWYTSTTRCIDARKSYWTSTKNFDELFWDIFDKTLLSTLDKNYTYVFILLHKENRIVVKHKINMLVYISRINNETYVEDYIQQFNNIYGIRRPKKIDTNIYEKDEINNMEKLYHPFKRGILIKTLNTTTNQSVNYKIDYENYINIKMIRGNVPEIRMRYLELLNDPERLQIFEQHYNEYKFMFRIIKNEVLKLIKSIYRLYVDSHIKHTIKVDDTNIYYKTLRQLHAQYKIKNVPISFDEVQKKIYTMDKKIIKKLLIWQELNQKTFNKSTLTENNI